MANINISRKHSKNIDEIKSIVDNLRGQLEKDYGVKSEWESADSLSIKGTGIKSGNLKISDSSIDIDIKLGMLASAMKGTIENKINSKLDELL